MEIVRCCEAPKIVEDITSVIYVDHVTHIHISYILVCPGIIAIIALCRTKSLFANW
jgi:hypothetical protein